MMLAALAVAGLAALGGGAAGLYAEMSRGPTLAEVTAAGRAEVATRWERLPAGRIFPASIRYVTTDGLITAARRAGIAPAASCAAGLDTAVARALGRQGCVRVLRSTYVDSSASLAGTVGVAVMPSTARAAQALAGFRATSAGVRAVGFRGTVTHLFTDSLRQEFGAVAAGPYIMFYAVGHASGLGVAPADSQALADFGTGLTTGEISVLTNGGPPCKRKDIGC
ncbi:MAG TPA: hypothetical protein VGS19_14230 [Streptosporangiaceae bacterium]|nr:hypothetical protein [Streptosporangiaceae bacterium]